MLTDLSGQSIKSRLRTASLKKKKKKAEKVCNPSTMKEKEFRQNLKCTIAYLDVKIFFFFKQKTAETKSTQDLCSINSLFKICPFDCEFLWDFDRQWGDLWGLPL